MIASKRSSALIALALLLPGCRPWPNGNSPDVQVTRAPICERLTVVRPSKSKDRISDDTARVLADNNIAIEEGCEPGASK